MDYFQMAYTTLGGLGIFFMGMKYLSDSLQLIAGDFIKTLISRVTSNPIMAVIVGMTITAIIQSSSVSTVMVVGLVNAGLVTLTQAIGVILGANIGTTITGWILAIKIGKYGLLLIGLGVFPMLFAKNERFSAAGEVIVALGLIFFGLELMSGAFKPLRTNAEFLNYMTYFDAKTLTSVLGCIAVGCCMTFVIQSSSAMLGITIALGATGSIPFQTAAALVLGENIGTTITAQLAAIGAGTNAKRAAVSHSLFNVAGVVIIISLFSPYIEFIDYLIPGSPDAFNKDGMRPYMAAHIASVHSVFNISATLIMLPFVNKLSQLVTWLVVDKEDGETHQLKYIGKPGIIGPAVALNMAALELGNMKSKVDEILIVTGSYVTKDGNRNEDFKKVQELEEVTDRLQVEITEFITHSIEGVLSLEQSERAYALIRSADELESIADYALSLCGYRKRLARHNHDFTSESWDTLAVYSKDIIAFYNNISVAFDGKRAKESVGLLTKQLNSRADEIRTEHLKRMSSGASPALSALTFSDMIVALRRIKNHSLNLYEALANENISFEG